METKLEAHTQYTDMEGTVALDWHDALQFNEFLKDHGVDTDHFFPIAIEVHAGELSQSISVYGVDKSKISDSADNIIEYARNNGNKLPLKEFDLECSLDDLLCAIKRFNLIVKKSWAKDFIFDVEEG